MMQIAQLRNADSENVCSDKVISAFKMIWIAPSEQVIEAG